MVAAPGQPQGANRLTLVMVEGSMHAACRLRDAVIDRAAWDTEAFLDLLNAAFRTEALRLRSMTDDLGLTYVTASRWVRGKGSPAPELRDRIVAWVIVALSARASELRTELEVLRGK